jgi:hypothetical protein
MIFKNGAGAETRTRIQSLFRETLLDAEKRPKRSPEETPSYEGGIISKVLTSLAVLINELQGDINRVAVLADLHTLADKYQPRQKQHNDKDGNKGKRKGEGDNNPKPEHPKKASKSNEENSSTANDLPDMDREYLPRPQEPTWYKDASNCKICNGKLHKEAKCKYRHSQFANTANHEGNSVTFADSKVGKRLAKVGFWSALPREEKHYLDLAAAKGLSKLSALNLSL